VSHTILLAERTVQLAMCRHMNHEFWRALACAADTYWLHRGTLTFRVPAAYNYTAVFRIGMNKIPPNLNTTFGAPIWVVRPI
jgi:hypothetical protein